MSSFDDVQRVNLDEEERLDPQSWYEIICRNPLGTHALLPHDIYSVLLEVARATISYQKWSWTGQAKVNRALDRLAAFGDLPGGD